MIYLKLSSDSFFFLIEPIRTTQLSAPYPHSHSNIIRRSAFGVAFKQLAIGLGRNVKDHQVIKSQLESIAKEQDTKTHQQTPYTLIDSAADSSYISKDMIIQRTMGEMITTAQQDMVIK